MTENRPDATSETAAPKHEVRDVNVRVVGLLALGLFASVLLVLWIVRGIFHSFAFVEARLAAPPPRLQANPLPPEPRLQTNASRDLEKMRTTEDEILHGYAWVDANAGIVRIPIERAMQLLAERNKFSPPQTESRHTEGRNEQ